MKLWYAIHTKPRQEEHAAEHLRRQEFEIYLPKIKQARRFRQRWRDTIEPLFPRYLFIRLDLGSDNVAPIRSTRGVSKLVSFNGLPATVPEPLIDALIESADPDSGLLPPMRIVSNPARPSPLSTARWQGWRPSSRPMTAKPARSSCWNSWARPGNSKSTGITSVLQPINPTPTGRRHKGPLSPEWH